MVMTRRIKIVEAIGPREPGQEKPILEEFLKMNLMKYGAFSVDNRLKGNKLKEDFLNKLFEPYETRNNEIRFYRYVHISSHGDGSSIFVGSRNCKITPGDLIDHSKQYERSPLSRTLITLSACGSLSGGFMGALAKLGVSAVVGPLNVVGFQESAMFFILFHFLLSQRLSDNESHGTITTSERIAEYIDIFQRSKTAYLNIGGTGAYRMSYWTTDHKKRRAHHLF